MAELRELWNLISNLSECKQVTKLWSGFQHSIQSEVWKVVYSKAVPWSVQWVN